MNLTIFFDTMICIFAMGYLVYYAHHLHILGLRIAFAITFIGLGFQLLRNFGFLFNNFSSAIFNSGIPLWALKEFGLLIMLVFLAPLMKEGR